MRKQIYLVQCCPRGDFRNAAKQGFKCKDIVYKSNTSPVWSTSTKKEAIKDCRNYNRSHLSECIYFILPIKLYN